MNFKKLLAAGLAACSLLTLAACSSESGTTDWEQYKQEDSGLDRVATGSGETAGTLRFESIDSDSVMIVEYIGPETPHSLTIPATVRTSTDESVAPKQVAAIAEEAFHSLSNLKEVTLPEGLEEIGAYAFAECKQLEKVTLPSTLTVVGDGAFYGCSKLTSVGAIASTKLTAISKQCFAECTALTELSVPASIKTLGQGAFMDCTALETVTLAEGVEKLGDQCFQGAKKLKNLTLCNSLTNTDPTADLTFYGTSDLIVTLPADASDELKAFVAKLKTADPA